MIDLWDLGILWNTPFSDLLMKPGIPKFLEDLRVKNADLPTKSIQDGAPFR